LVNNLQLLIVAASFVRCILWVIGAVIAFTYRESFPRANLLIGIGMGMASINSAFLAMPSWPVFVFVHSPSVLITVFSVASVILIVQGLYMRTQESKKLIKSLSELADAHTNK
jgi:glucose uptake protein GlcU